jgi:hypothetical protein
MLGHGRLEPAKFKPAGTPGSRAARVSSNPKIRPKIRPKVRPKICLTTGPPLPIRQVNSLPPQPFQRLRRNPSARAGLLMTIVPISMSCKSRRRSLKNATTSTNGVRNETVIQ